MKKRTLLLPQMHRFTLILAGALIFSLHPASAAVDTWSGADSNNSTNWTDATNWTGVITPSPYDSLIFTGNSVTNNNDFPNGTAFDGVTFDANAGAFTLSGNGLLLSGNSSAITTGVANNSAAAQTVNLNLNLDWGAYTFASPAGSLALNGTLTPNAGGVAIFGAGVTSTTMTADASGLVTGLGGAALYGNTGVGGGFTALAQISGGVISPYTYTSGQQIAAAGALPSDPSGINIELTATTAGSYTLANPTGVNFINTIFVANNTATKIVVPASASGTLDLGTVDNIGGIYLLSAAGIGGGLIVGGTNCLLTAGPMTGSPTPGTIVFGINGTTSGNQAQGSAIITNNGSGGAVTVVKAGAGSMFFDNHSNAYTGGTYVLQGQLQANNLGSFGAGPVYVASGATVFFTSGSTANQVNNLFISPGNGTAVETGTTANPGSVMLNSGSQSFTGTLTLMGAPSAFNGNYPPPAGDRLTADAGSGLPITETFTGQITGSGTLDFATSPHAGTFALNNPNTTGPNANNWTGGLIIEETLASPSSARNIILKLRNTNQIPSGPGTGDVIMNAVQTSGSVAGEVQLDLTNNNATINGLNSPNNALIAITNSGITGTLTVGANNNNASFGGQTGDSGAVNGPTHTLNLVKIGSGTQTFTGLLKHYGSTIVSNGSVVLSGGATIPNSPVIAVAAGATLDASGLGGLTIAANQNLSGEGTVVGSTVIDGSINPSMGTIGTLLNNGNVTFASGGAYIWNLNNATGTAGSDSGWSLLAITNGSLAITANSTTPFVIKITSLTTLDAAGNAANFNANVSGSWTLAQSASPITGFSPSAFTLNTSAFSNGQGSGAFSVALSPDGMSLLLVFTSAPAVTTALVNQTNNAGATAVFTVVAGGATPPVTYQWLEGSAPLSNGGTTASGAAVAITVNGNTSTLSIAGAQDADAGGYTVNVSDNFGASGTSSATLTVIDPPSGVNVSPSQGSSVLNGGSGQTFAATVNGTSPFTYIWTFNGATITNGGSVSGANTANLTIGNLTSADVGSYSLLVSNQAGIATFGPSVISAVSVVPNQIIFEPFNYALQGQDHGVTPWTAFGVTNVYNQTTGVGVGWINTGSVADIDTLLQTMFDSNFAQDGTTNDDQYPWPGLAGNDPHEIYEDSDIASDVNLPLGAGGGISNGSVYFSTIIELTQGASLASFNTPLEYLCGFGTGAANSATRNTSIFIQEPGDDSFRLGVFKTSGAVSSLSAGVNGNWASDVLHRGEVLLVVCRLTFHPGTNATCDLWVDPAPSTYYTNEANVPAPDVADAAGGASDVGSVDFFYSKITSYPASRFYADLRIGSTWASVTPPSWPALSLTNVLLAPDVTNAVFASQNAGDPAATYQWQFNNGPVLSDGVTAGGSVISGSSTATLTISGVTGSDLGAYTVTGVNSDPVWGITQSNSASATLSFVPPPLQAAYSAPDITISWPTNWVGYTLQESSDLTSTNWATVSNPPYPVAGTNNSVSIDASSGTEFFRLVK